MNLKKYFPFESSVLAFFLIILPNSFKLSAFEAVAGCGCCSVRNLDFQLGNNLINLDKTVKRRALLPSIIRPKVDKSQSPVAHVVKLKPTMLFNEVPITHVQLSHHPILIKALQLFDMNIRSRLDW